MPLRPTDNESQWGRITGRATDTKNFFLCGHSANVMTTLTKWSFAGQPLYVFSPSPAEPPHNPRHLQISVITSPVDPAMAAATALPTRTRLGKWPTVHAVRAKPYNIAKLWGFDPGDRYSNTYACGVRQRSSMRERSADEYAHICGY